MLLQPKSYLSSLHTLPPGISNIGLIFEACVPSNMMPSSLALSSQLSLGFPTLFLLRIICCRISFGIQYSKFLITHPAHCNCLYLINFSTISHPPSLFILYVDVNLSQNFLSNGPPPPPFPLPFWTWPTSHTQNIKLVKLYGNLFLFQFSNVFYCYK